MSVRLVRSGDDGEALGEVLGTAIDSARPNVVGVVSAFVSRAGVELLGQILPRVAGRDVRLLAGTSLSFTHPTALSSARSREWIVRLGRSQSAIFHPKLVICGNSFSQEGAIIEPTVAYVGSANLTRPGLQRNVECGALFLGGAIPHNAGETFRELWAAADPLTAERLEAYSADFTERNRSRKARDLQEFGVTDAPDVEGLTAANIREHERPQHHALQHQDADTVWIGLESSTGEYTFQPEFPRDVGGMVLRMLNERGIEPRSAGNGRRRRLVSEVDVLCSDAVVREMTFTYYSHNSMSRLNVPNDVPDAEWARDARAGIAVVSRSDDPNAVVSLEILRPGSRADEVARRSFVLGTWGKTTTRAYGWY